MGRKAKIKQARREARRHDLPVCSYRNCPNGRPPSTHIIRKKDGTFFASCDSCVAPMMQALKLAGVDAQVVTHAALALLARGAKKVIPTPSASPADPIV